jgi:hypothetical protein
MRRRSWRRALAFALAISALAGCASISPARQDLTIVEGRFAPDWECGNVRQDEGGYFFVCDMSIEVQRVVFGEFDQDRVVSRYFWGEMENEEDFYVWHSPRDTRAAAILWRGEEGMRSYVLLRLPGRWCVPDWMVTELGFGAGETARLQRAGYPLCSAARP